MKIRLARDEDYAALAQLRRQTIRHVNSKDYPPGIIDNWAKRTGTQDFRNSAHICKRWVALDKEKITGFCEHNLQGELTRIYVHKAYLRQGVGCQLLSTAEASIKKLGFNKVPIEATITAKDFYEKCGYKIIRQTVSKVDGTLIYEMLKRF